jgi:citrate/tricarballylate utilization protein
MSGLLELIEEANREFAVCNACRYCEGYCAVFPALEVRSSLKDGDVVYLANLCHDCRACFQACMYAPPHEFGVNIPKVMAEVRSHTYATHAWPKRLAAHLGRTPAVTAWTIAGLILALTAVWVTGNIAHLFNSDGRPGAFYKLVPYALLVASGMVSTVFVLSVIYSGLVTFWRNAGGSTSELFSIAAWKSATGDALKLRYQEGGGPGCYYPDASQPSMVRRYLHSLVAYGFLAAFVSTVLAALWQDLLGQLPPFPVLSPPVLFGIAGGVAMTVGCTGLLYLKARSSQNLQSESMRQMDVAFLVVLNLASVTGLLTLALRGTGLMGTALVIHLALLVALYATAPYGKFVHFVYRFAALLLYRAEEQRATR